MLLSNHHSESCTDSAMRWKTTALAMRNYMPPTKSGACALCSVCHDELNYRERKKSSQRAKEMSWERPGCNQCSVKCCIFPIGIVLNKNNLVSSSAMSLEIDHWRNIPEGWGIKQHRLNGSPNGVMSIVIRGLRWKPSDSDLCLNTSMEFWPHEKQHKIFSAIIEQILPLVLMLNKRTLVRCLSIKQCFGIWQKQQGLMRHL